MTRKRHTEHLGRVTTEEGNFTLDSSSVNAQANAHPVHKRQGRRVDDAIELTEGDIDEEVPWTVSIAPRKLTL